MKKILFLFHLFCYHFETYCHISRNRQHNSAVFRKVFIVNHYLDISPLQTLENIETARDCVYHCVATKGCVSINFHPIENECSLLAEDRQTHSSLESFTKHEHIEYYDTVSIFVFSTFLHLMH